MNESVTRSRRLSAPQWQRVLIMLLLVQLMLLLPVALMLPAWLVVLPLLTGYWQWQVVHGRWHEAPRWLRNSLVILLPALLLLTGLHPGALDFYVSLAFIGVALKLVELRGYRDAYVVSLLALFVLASLLLMDQGLFYTLYVFFGASLCLAALLRLHAPQGISLLRAWRSSGRAILYSVPFMLLLFVAFPRLPPIWQMPSTTEQAQTGLSDTMSPGDVAELVQNNDVMFRARFDGEPPPQRELYWRAMTMNHFDGERWFQWQGSRQLPSSLVGSPELPSPAPDSPMWSYELALSTTYQPWVATLENMTGFQSQDARWVVDNRLVWPGNITQSQGLTAEAAADVVPPDSLSQMQREAALQLPDNGNPRAHELAEELRLQSDSDDAFMDRLMDHFGNAGFVYSLRPGTAQGADTIDYFLFDSQIGFCAHYAEAMVFMARSVDIPARVVTGYLGGRWSSDGSYLVVRAQEAHAWVEVWLDGQGWVRFDPTSVVAPDRLEGSLSDVLQDEQDLRPATWSDGTAPGWLQQVYWQWDNVQYGWQRWVLNFDADDQDSLMDRWLGGWSAATWTVIGVTLFLSVFGSWYVILLAKQKTWTLGLPRLEKRARQHCLKQVPDLPVNEGLTHWVSRLESEHPLLAGALARFADEYLPAVYGPAEQQAARKTAAKRQLRRLVKTNTTGHKNGHGR